MIDLYTRMPATDLRRANGWYGPFYLHRAGLYGGFRVNLAGGFEVIVADRKDRSGFDVRCEYPR